MFQTSDSRNIGNWLRIWNKRKLKSLLLSWFFTMRLCQKAVVDGLASSHFAEEILSRRDASVVSPIQVKSWKSSCVQKVKFWLIAVALRCHVFQDFGWLNKSKWFPTKINSKKYTRDNFSNTKVRVKVFYGTKVNQKLLGFSQNLQCAILEKCSGWRQPTSKLKEEFRRKTP